MNPQTLYDRTAASWGRTEPTSLSDFTGRPAVFELCGEVAGARVLDLGCGEGYCARELARRGATVLGVDQSAEMIALAREAERAQPMGIDYRVASVVDLEVAERSFERVIAVFLFNYLSIEEMGHAMSLAYQSLTPGGGFVFAVPHPSFAFVHDGSAPFFFDFEGRGYFSGRDHIHSGEIHRRDGRALEVQARHKVVADYFEGLRNAGFDQMPRVRELAVTSEHLAMDPAFFGPVADTPLHLAIAVER